jgi:Anti-sigma-K factor rskA
MTDDMVGRRATALETASRQAGLTPDERATVDQLRSVLAHPAVWAAPPDLPVHPAAIDTALEPVPTAPAPKAGTGLTGGLPTRLGNPWRSRRLRWGLGATGLAAAVSAVVVTLLPAGDPVRFDLAGTAAAPGAHATVTAVKQDAGWHLELDTRDLPGAPDGAYYQGWVVRGSSYVPLGTFHLRRAGEVELWAGVPVDEYTRLEITRQRIGGEQSPGELILYGEIPPR